MIRSRFGKEKIPVVPQLSYSQDLRLGDDVFLFPNSKSHLKGFH